MQKLLDDLKNRWKKAKPRERMTIVFGGLIGGTILLAIAISPKAPVIHHKEQISSVTFGMPGNGGESVKIESLSAQIEALKNKQAALTTGQSNIQKAMDKEQSTIPGQVESNPKVRDLQSQVAELKAQLGKQNNLENALPPDSGKDAPVPPAGQHHHNRPILPDDNAPLPGDDQTATAPAEPEQPEFEVIGGAGSQEAVQNGSSGMQPVNNIATTSTTSPNNSGSSSGPSKKDDDSVYLPAGTSFEGNLLNGMEAPTAGFAEKQPVPAIMRIRTDALLPNRFRYDVKECMVVVAGYGVLSDERANLQTSILTCVRHDGSVIEAKIEGYVVGEDGRVGMRGRLISRQGALLAKTFAAGFLSGLANFMSPMAVPQLNTMPGSTTQYQTPNVSMMAQGGLAQGVSQSGQMLANFYMSMARQEFPVVQIDAGRRGTIMLLKGVKLSFHGRT